MNKIFLPFMTATMLSTILFTGCGRGTSTEDTNTTILEVDLTPVVSETLDKTSKSTIGTLSDATVNIYALGEGAKELLYTETTTNGSTVDEIGNFETHGTSLNQNRFYMYEVVDGNNMDVDQDGVVDDTPTQNRTIYRAIYRGTTPHVAWWSVDTSELNSTVEKYVDESQ